MNSNNEIGGTELQDFTDLGMHVTWLVHNPDAFGTSPGPTSDRDRLLHFGLNYQEWKNLYFDVIGVNRIGYEQLLKKIKKDSQSILISEFDENDPQLKEYPMLSRICGIHYDAIFETDEIEQLCQECLRLKAQTSNEIASRGLDKLLLICQWAKQLNLNIYLMAN